MPRPLLFIAIPTRNRSGYLRDILENLVKQIQALGARASEVVLHVSDNTSTDATQQVVRASQEDLPALRYHRHPENVGAGRNIIACVRASVGDFTWVLGDDEVVRPGAVAHLLDLLSAAPAPDLTLCFDTNYDLQLTAPRRFASFRDYAKACAVTNPHALIEHTLISSNVFRTDLFDAKVAEASLTTDYPHMYALMSGLLAQGGSVHITEHEVITVRDRRAPAVDGEWPADLEASWKSLLQWQRDHFGVEELQPERALERVRQKLIHNLTRHPVRYLRNNLHALRDPKAWGWFLRRLGKHLLGR